MIKHPDYDKLALDLHRRNRGKIRMESKVPLETALDLSLAYTPGVAAPCREIQKDPAAADIYTNRRNTVAIVSDGTAVLGLGDIGAYGALPVMEGKAILFKAFAGIDAVPLCLKGLSPEEMVRFLEALEPSFGGINLEDISAPDCFYIEKELQKRTSIPIFHDDQHGTAVVTLAALHNSLKIVGKKMENLKVVVNGAGAAGMAIASILLDAGVRELLILDRRGILVEGRQEGMNPYKEEMARRSNPWNQNGSLSDALEGADVFIGVSQGGLLDREKVRSMAKDAIIFALANPVPEIMPEEARLGGAGIICTGRSDLPNQVNNVLAFPGIFKGALESGARRINEAMKLAAAETIASLVPPQELSRDNVIPSPFQAGIADAVAEAVAQAAIESGATELLEK